MGMRPAWAVAGPLRRRRRQWTSQSGGIGALRRSHAFVWGRRGYSMHRLSSGIFWFCLFVRVSLQIHDLGAISRQPSCRLCGFDLVLQWVRLQEPHLMFR